jgi:hypothetical protein
MILRSVRAPRRGVRIRAKALRLPIAIALAIALAACAKEPERGPGDTIAARRAADMIHAALAADRAIYSREVINRLGQVQKVMVVDSEGGGAPKPLEGREDWKSEHGKLPLPAQMFRMGAEETLTGDSGLSYLLLSPWPINGQNIPRTDLERTALERLTRERAAVYDSEVLDGRTYFVALYPDLATVKACISCHNDHPDSPRRDFKVGDVMGAMVIRFPL